MRTIEHKFVDQIPDEMSSGILYISVNYATAIHKCVCGCGNEVVTPFSPSDWKLLFDGETITLRPSIGNWNFKCRSHYWITNSRIEKAYSRFEKEPQQEKAGEKSKGRKRKKKWWNSKK